jgi:HAD superfamily hydrolase (TIGR01509 family)
MSTPALRAILWDVDGTLAETERDGHRPAFNLAFESAGLPWQWGVERYGELLQITGGRERILHDLKTQAMAPPTVAGRETLARELHQHKNTLYAQRTQSHPIPLRPGVLELITECRHREIVQGIVTTTSRSNVDALLTPHLGKHWPQWFPIIICGEDVSAKKPHPEAYELAAAQLKLSGIAAIQSIAIEDSPNGIQAACGARIPVILTRSVYFESASGEGTFASGQSLHERSGWITPSNDDACPRGDHRVCLNDLVQWHAAHVARSHSS